MRSSPFHAALLYFGVDPKWQQVCEDKTLADLPYKIELDKYGKLIMSPTHKRRSKLQVKIQRLLLQLMPTGDPLPECAVETAEGIKVPDVAWISTERWASLNPDEASCSKSPEICIEILSPANAAGEMLGTLEKPGKRELYFAAGANEFWMCDEAGRILFYSPSGQLTRSLLCPNFRDKV
jgi:Uma2 family endonuclease